MSAAIFQMQCFEPVQTNVAMNKQLWPWLKSMTMAGNRVTVECRLTEDAKTDAQRRFYHGVILLQIANQANVNGQKFPLKVWKEWFRDKYLGFKTVTFINPMTGKKSRRRIRKSTEDLGAKGYNVLIERVSAFAATELGVEFTERLEQYIDPETGEILEQA